MRRSIFDVPMFGPYQVENWSKDLKKDLLTRFSNSNHHMDGCVITDYQHGGVVNFPDYKNFVLEILEPSLREFSDDIEIPLENVLIYDMWYETSNEHGHHNIHTHGAIGYSACFYVDFDSAIHEGTVFLSPLHNFITGLVNNYQVKDTQEGSVIFFPSCVMHSAPCNDNKKSRTVCSFNMKFQ